MSYDRTNEDYEARVASDTAAGFPMPPESDTPETDAEALTGAEFSPKDQLVPADFARRLERRLNAAQEENTALREKVRELEAGLALGQLNCDEAYEDLRSERDAARADAERLADAIRFADRKCRFGSGSDAATMWLKLREALAAHEQLKAK